MSDPYNIGPDELRQFIERIETQNEQIAAEKMAEALREAIRWAHDTLWEINPENYSHDEVCKLNDASVEVILGLAVILGEKHGKSDEWWQSRAALAAMKGDQPQTDYEKKVASLKEDFPNGI